MINLEFFDKLAVQDVGNFRQRGVRNGFTDLCKREVSSRKRNSQSLTREHHDHTFGTGFVSEPFGVAGKRNASVIDNRLVHGSGYDTVCFSFKAGRECVFQSLGNVARVFSSCDTWNHSY